VTQAASHGEAPYDRVSAYQKLIQAAGLLVARGLHVDDLKTVATLPPMATLRARLLGNMQGPMAGFVSVLAASLGGFVRVLQARADQLQPEASPETA